ncbi:MAG TPA: inositol-3-phosphate synthase, partial [Streptosporangiaceae bacterium]|nr:inositol-3-phosphate synthase [Streptosporangiaceae bacterium]
VFGGHDIAATPLTKQAERLAEGGVIPSRLLAALRDELAAADAEIKPGIPSPGCGPAVAAADLARFRERRGLDRVVVINLASTEPPATPYPEHHSLPELERALAAGRAVLPPSSLYAYAAFRSGCAYVDFTPSTGARLPALEQLARAAGLPYAGSDAKTGETLVKSVLAPMFAQRALRVRSWSGTNLLGGGDGATLADPMAAASKRASKGRLLKETLPDPVAEIIHIDQVADMGDWKTAWDHVTFEGFLGVKMTMQFTWQGCDSTLAAPLVIDLARLMSHAHAAGHAGPVAQLAFFFKNPVASAGHGLAEQYAALTAWACPE